MAGAHGGAAARIRQLAANDNFKGVDHPVWFGRIVVSALAGAGHSIDPARRVALHWRWPAALIHAFSGKGIVPAELLDAPLIASIALAAATTVLLADALRLSGLDDPTPSSGGVAGAGLVAAGGALEFLALARAFVLPLLVGDRSLRSRSPMAGSDWHAAR